MLNVKSHLAMMEMLYRPVNHHRLSFYDDRIYYEKFLMEHPYKRKKRRKRK